MVSALFFGFFVMTPVLPGEFTLADETAAPLLADAACRAVDKYRAASTCWGRRAPDERYPGRTVRRAAGRRQCRSRPGWRARAGAPDAWNDSEHGTVEVLTAATVSAAGAETSAGAA